MDLPPQPNGWPQPPVQAQVASHPTVYAPRTPSLLGRLAMVFLVVLLCGSIALNFLLMMVVGITAVGSAESEGRIQEKFVSHNRHAKNKVAILSIEGTILSAEGFFKQQIDHARKDAEDGNLKALVVYVNSPGGTITGSDAMLHYLKKLSDEEDIPIVVSMGGIAASGGYYVSMCVGDRPDTIFAEPTTWTGSIGVVIPHFNVEDLLKKWGVQEDAIASDPLKTMGSITRKMTAKEREIFQGLVDAGFTQFKDAIKQGRPAFKKAPEKLDSLATGQVFTAQQALDNGLIDKIGFIEDAIDRAVELTKLPKDQVKVVRYKAEPRLADILFGQSQARAPFDLAMLLDATSPRAYYLCTWLPTLAASKRD